MGMTEQEALELLQRHNRWRRGDDSVEMADPRAIGLAIGNPEGRGVGRLQWEREDYGDILNRMGKTLWVREYDV
jgi:hypothetical protein